MRDFFLRDFFLRDFFLRDFFFGDFLPPRDFLRRRASLINLWRRFAATDRVSDRFFLL